jgi:glycosyltransferase involved in cell wall biosynthesis
MAVGHVLTDDERTEYAAKYGLSAERLVKVRWPLCRTGAGSLAEITGEFRRVLSSGRAGSDWETLFRAADGADWSLTVICSSIDEQRVRNLSRGRADVHAELDRAAHDSILRASDVYVMAMKERGVSAGHVRLMAAVEAGVPVVASEIRALEEYVVPGETAVMISPGAASALRREVDALLEDPSRRQVLRDAALARARAWTHKDYFERMRALILSVGAS